MNAGFSKNFSRQLRFWAIHVPLNALPSFIIAVSLFRLGKHPHAIVAMLAVIVFFIIALATAAAMIPDLNRKDHPLARALRTTMIFRAWTIGLSAAMLVIAPRALLLIPDLWCGYLASNVVKGLSRFLHAGTSQVSSGSVLPVLLTTIVEGVIIAMAIAMITFFLCLCYQGRERRKAFTSAGSPARLR